MRFVVLTDQEGAALGAARAKRIAECDHAGLTWHSAAKATKDGGQVRPWLVGAIVTSPDRGVRVRCRTCTGTVQVASVTALGARDRARNLRSNANGFPRGDAGARTYREQAREWDEYAEERELTTGDTCVTV